MGWFPLVDEIHACSSAVTQCNVHVLYTHTPSAHLSAFGNVVPFLLIQLSSSMAFLLLWYVPWCKLASIPCLTQYSLYLCILMQASLNTMSHPVFIIYVVLWYIIQFMIHGIIVNANSKIRSKRGLETEEHYCKHKQYKKNTFWTGEAWELASFPGSLLKYRRRREPGKISGNSCRLQVSQGIWSRPIELSGWIGSTSRIHRMTLLQVLCGYKLRIMVVRWSIIFWHQSHKHFFLGLFTITVTT